MARRIQGVWGVPGTRQVTGTRRTEKAGGAVSVVRERGGILDSAVGSRMVLLRSQGSALQHDGQSLAAGRERQ
jgi:hypothetical protein